MSLSRFLYRLARVSRDINAVSRGPRAFGKRAARKLLGRAAGKLINKLVGK